jgi:hypothetical protein
MANLNMRAAGRTWLLLASTALLSACGSGSSSTGAAGEKTASSEETSQSASLPHGLALMPGAKVIGADDAGKVNLEVAASSADVAKFYKAEFERVGIAVENDMVMQGNMILSGKAADGEDVVVNAADGKDGSPTSITVAAVKDAG